MAESPYFMTLSLNVLNHLGISLYSNVPAVLSEIVANAWDADAQNVDVTIDTENGLIRIVDDGHGMSQDDVNQKFLTVGYRRRAIGNGGGVTPRFKRKVMGRKGIGKLSLFAIARHIKIFTRKNGIESGFKMLLSDIEQQIQDGEGKYKPGKLKILNPMAQDGTRIELRDLKKNQNQTESALRKRLARRFSILGERSKFSLTINGVPVTIADREYFNKVQFLWHYGNPAGILDSKVRFENTEDRPKTLEYLDDADEKCTCEVTGWIGSVKEAGDLADRDDNLNKIVIMVRGKMAQEDILIDFNEGGIYTKYLIGELHADFLDEDTLDDIATSSRQKIVETDPRYLALKNFVYGELKHIQQSWTDLRNQKGTDEALLIPAIDTWFKKLGPDSKKRAQKLFGKINQLTVQEPKEKKELLKYSVLAFEHLSFKENLDALENITPDNIGMLKSVFSSLDEFEASLYYEIISGRLETIDTLQRAVDENQLEKVIQQYIADKLWLLDPAWERATDSVVVESTLAKEFADIDFKLTREEKAGRLDIRYATTTGTHIIIELKRPNVKTTVGKLMDQGKKYTRGMQKLLTSHGIGDNPILLFFLIGEPLKGWDDSETRKDDLESFKAQGMRVLLYRELLDNAKRIYGEYLEKRKESGRLRQLLDDIEQS